MFWNSAYRLNNCSSAICKLSAFSDSLALSNSNSVCNATPELIPVFVVLIAPVCAILFIDSTLLLIESIIDCKLEPDGCNK